MRSRRSYISYAKKAFFRMRNVALIVNLAKSKISYARMVFCSKKISYAKTARGCAAWIRRSDPVERRFNTLKFFVLRQNKISYAKTSRL